MGSDRAKNEGAHTARSSVRVPASAPASAPAFVPAPEPGADDIGVVIVTHNSARDLPRCLETLLDPAREEADRPQGVVVADNASRDDTLRVADRPGVLLRPMGANLGYGRAANRALDDLATPYALLCNPDVWFPPGSLAAMRRFMRQQPDCDVQGPRMENEAGQLLTSCRRFPTWRAVVGRRLGGFGREVDRHLMADFDHASPRRVDWVSGACMLFPRHFRFDPRYHLYVEDVDFCYDKRVYYNPHAVVGHRVSRASVRSLPMMGRHLRSMLQFAWKHRGNRAGRLRVGSSEGRGRVAGPEENACRDGCRDRT